MRIPFLSLKVIATILTLTGCTKDDQNLRDFYLSQPRDPNLIDRWKSTNDPTMYQIYSEDGYVYNYSEGDIDINGSQGDCWYTEGDSILRRYYYAGSYFKSSKEYPARYYKIENDFLYISDKRSFEALPNYQRVKE